MLVAKDLEKTYRSGDRPLTVLRDVSLHLEEGDFLAILGASGSGKTTLLGLLAGLDTPTKGTVRIAGTDLTPLTEDERARFRRKAVGFVFQSFQLIPSLTAREYVQVPLELRGDSDAPARAANLLARVGLGDRLDHYPTQLSGGEQQRVALARAFVHEPRILFADEPTGNLDATTGESIIELMEELNRERGTTLVLVTHDPALAKRARRTIRLADGRVVSDSAAETSANKSTGEKSVGDSTAGASSTDVIAPRPGSPTSR
jgi:putative ABC transport system ATP-binding protein